MSKAAVEVRSYLTAEEQQEIVLANVKLAAKFTKKLLRQSGRVDCYDDAYAEAMVGLLEAARRFDPSRGFQFSTFAAFWIKMKVRSFLDDFRHVVRPPHGSREERVAYQFLPVQRRLSQRFGRQPASHEMIEELQCTRDQYDAAVVRFRRHDAVVSHGDHEDGAYVPPCSVPGPEAAFSDAEHAHVNVAVICRALSFLTPQEREVIRRRYLAEEGETLRQIGASWDRTRERVRQIEVSAMAKLRKILEPLRVDLVGEGV